MRLSAILPALLCTAAALPAQANDFAGIRIFSGGSGSPQILACGTPFSCTPTSFTLAQGSTVSAVTLGTPLNGLYVIAASFDTANLGCIQLPFPGLVNRLVLNPASILTLVTGVASFNDNGRCNGGTSGAIVLFTIPTGIPSGALAFQAVMATPLSAGGVGLGLSNAVIMNY